jgi:FkbM family methyltransferase
MTQALSTIEVSARGAQRLFCYRSQSAGDRGVVQQIFSQNDYSLNGMPQSDFVARYVRARRAAGRKPFIVDAGANIGASAVWFALNYPGCHLIAIEPERDNCRLLRRNCEGLDCEILEGGISSSDGSMFLADPGRGDWGFRLSADAGGYQVPTFSAAGLVTRLQGTGYDPLIFKVDIEGGEAELFSKNVDWVDACAVLIVELHDWMLPGSASSRNFLRTISALDMDFVHRGENVFCFNNRLLSAFAGPVDRVAELRQLASEDPSPNAFLELSLACFQAKDFLGCVAASTEALKLNPGFSEAHNNLGIALAELERWPEAMSAFEEALRLSPSNQLARNNLAWVRSRADSPAPAR